MSSSKGFAFEVTGMFRMKRPATDAQTPMSKAHATGVLATEN